MREGRLKSKGGEYPSRQGSPPDMTFFEDERRPGGTAALGLSLGDLRLEIEGLGAELAAALYERYSPYADHGARRDRALRVRFGLEDRDYFIEPPGHAEFTPVWLACDGERIRFVGYRVCGWFNLDRLDGRLLLARGTHEPELRAIENYVRVAVAWMAASRGGALVHAVGAVLGERAYIFYGESGAGKSTLAAVNTRATIISDDLSLVLPGPHGGLELVGSPFRGTYESGAPVQGRFPLVAAFRLIQAKEAAVVEVPRLIAFGQLVGNLTFVAEAFDVRPDLFASVERAFAGIPLQHLHCRKDDTYWDAIVAAGL